MKAIRLILSLLTLAFFVFGCSQETERENPLDAMNERTGGIPPGMSAHAGDSQAILSWHNMEFEGVKEYRLYRAYLTPEQFEQIASVQAKPMDETLEYAYTDTELQNDGDNEYFYRLSYVDSDGVETPDPAESLSLPEDWFVVSVIPSEAPPTPNVQVMEDTDLQIRLLWEGYSAEAPEDLAGFRVFVSLKAEDEQEQDFYLAAEIDEPTVEFYIHGNNYAEETINFSEDGVTKLFKVVAFDTVGVESDPIILEGTSPNLPPRPPSQVSARWTFGMNSYEVMIEWKKNLEPDVIGYVIYALKPDGTQEFKQKINDPNETRITISDHYVVIEGMLVPKQYYVTAYDKSPRDDGTRDESEPSEILSGI